MARSKHQTAPALPPANTDVAARNDGAALRHAAALAHDLQVHQIELELQNEELQLAQMALAVARDRFIDLYDFAPVGYLTLDGDGHIVEANLTGAALLGLNRKALTGRPFVGFVGALDADRWLKHLPGALAQDGGQRIELALRPRGGALLYAQLDCLRVVSDDGVPMLRVTLTDVSQRRLAEMDRRITANVVEAREADRRRMAHELHEELGQRLSALKMDLGSLPASNPEQGRRIADMLSALDDAVATVRRISTELRPMMLDDLGLHAAMDWLAKDSARRLGLTVELRLDPGDPPLGERASITLYRMMQATLEHMARHAQAGNVHIELQRRPGKLLLSLQDTGTSRPAPAGAADQGDANQPLHEQARMLGGHLEVAPVPGGGQRYTLHLSVDQPVDPP